MTPPGCWGRGVTVATVLVGLTPCAPARQTLRLPAILSDHAVLQREAAVPIWGWAAPGDEVSVSASWSGEVLRTHADGLGRWELAARTGPAGGPHSLTVATDGQTLELRDVLFGEVWLCSGQSNMEWSVERCADAGREIAAGDQPLLRLFTVGRALAPAPAADVAGAWTPCTPRTVAAFSATAYYFGRDLARELDVPIGLVASSWGGTPAEAWTSGETIARFPELAPALGRLAAPEPDRPLADRQTGWWQAVEERDPGLAGAWMRAELPEEGWRDGPVPGRFSDVELGSFDGCVWYRRTVALPDGWAGRELSLELGPVDDMDLTFFNGELVGSTTADGQWQVPRRYVVPAGLARAGDNVLAVCAVDTGGYGSIGVAGDVRPPMRLRPAADPEAGGLALEGIWRVRAGLPLEAVGAYPREGWPDQHTPTVLYNGMLAPLVPFRIRGAIWYQGESNRARAAQYRRLFPALITDWRARWGIGDFPFYYVQIAPFAYEGDAGQAAELREAQTMALALPATGMAVTMDIGDPRDIHPTNKQDVGRRLALWALARTYGRDVACSGPLYRSMEASGGSIRLRFDHAGGGLATRDGGPLTHFTVAGEDRVFHPAEAAIDGSDVVVTSPSVPAPVAVRHAWGAADEPNLVNRAGLPAPSFRTDDWPPVSADR